MSQEFQLSVSKQVDTTKTSNQLNLGGQLGTELLRCTTAAAEGRRGGHIVFTVHRVMSTQIQQIGIRKSTWRDLNLIWIRHLARARAVRVH